MNSPVVVIPVRSFANAKLWMEAASSADSGIKLPVLFIETYSLTTETQVFDNYVYVGGRDVVNLISSLEKDVSLVKTCLGHSQGVRGYGGSSNLALLLASVVDCSFVLKLDEDTNPAEGNWLDVLSKNERLATDIMYGTFLNEVYKEEAFDKEFQELVTTYSRVPKSIHSIRERSNGTKLNNGIVLMSHNSIVVAPYPVLFDEVTGICLRGEAYYREELLAEVGVSQSISETMTIGHREGDRDLSYWLKQMLLGGDLVYTFSAMHYNTELPLIVEARIERRNEEVAKIEASAGINSILRDELVTLVKEHSIRITDESLARYNQAQKVWPSLCETMLRTELAAKVKLLSSIKRAPFKF